MKDVVSMIQAGYAGINIVTQETDRVRRAFIGMAGSMDRPLLYWRIGVGLLDDKPDSKPVEAPDPFALCDVICAQEEGKQVHVPEKSIVLLPDWHLLMQSDASLVAAMRDTLRHSKAHGIVLVALSCKRQVPDELAHDWATVEWGLPDKPELLALVTSLAEQADVSLPDVTLDSMAENARGLTAGEAENAFAKAILEDGGATAVAALKADALNKSGLLEVLKANVKIADVGGLDNLKAWLLKRKAAFTQDARDAGLPVPKGILIVGLPGTGKSLIAKAVADLFDLPAVRWDFSRMMGGIVGQTEGNFRSAIETLKSMAPCVAHCDEIDKGAAGSSGKDFSGDSGAKKAGVGTFLTWMQDKTEPVFVVATANEVTQLPPEMLRKGRFDELFFVDLPNVQDRQAIARIHAIKCKAKLTDEDFAQIADASDGYNGAEIEAAFKEAQFTAFAADRRAIRAADVMEGIASQVPLSRTMAEQLANIRTWAQGRCRMASGQRATTQTSAVQLGGPVKRVIKKA